MKARVTGKVVLATDQSFGAGERKFSFLELSIQTGVASIDQVRITDSFPRSLVPRVGDVVDLEVELSAYAGRSGTSVNATAVGAFDESYVLSLLETAAA